MFLISVQASYMTGAIYLNAHQIATNESKIQARASERAPKCKL